MPWRTIDGRGDAPTRDCPSSQVLLEGVFEQAPLPRPAALLHRLRGRRRRTARQEDGRLPPVPRGARGEETLRAASCAPVAKRGATSGRSQAASRRPARRRGLAHAGLGQEPDDGVLRRPRHPAAGDGEPDARRAHRPQRPRRPALRHLRALPRPAAPAAGAGRRPRRTCASCSSVAVGRRGLHDDPEVLPGGEGRPASRLLSDRRNIVVIADEAHRSQYDFIDGFARHMRDALPQRLVHRLHRHADRADRREHARGVRRLHQRLRHPARRRRTARRCRSTTRAGWPSSSSTRPSGRRSTPSSRRPPRARRSSARRSSRPSGRSSRPWSARRSGSSWSRATSSSTSRSGCEAMDGKAMVVCMSRRICVELYREIVALRPDWHGDDDDAGRDQGRDDRLGLRPARLAAAHPQQAAARGAGEALPRPERPVQARASCATCGSPASTRRACTRCTSTSRCAGTG